MIRVFRPIPVESLKLLVFDLDGTLIDSAQDLCNSVNATLAHFDRPPLPDEVIAGYIGNGAPDAGAPRLRRRRRRRPSDEDSLAKAYAFFLDYYREHKLDYTYAYDGVLEALAALAHRPRPARRARSRAMAVLTNKPVRPARAICEALGLAPYFLNIYGGNSFTTKKPDPEGLFALMQEAGRAPRRDRHDRRQPGGRADRAQRRRLVASAAPSASPPAASKPSLPTSWSIRLRTGQPL